MTEKQMLDKLEAIRKASQQDGKIYYALCNGEDLVFTTSYATKEAFKEGGFWVVAIFEHGHRVEA